MLTRRIPANGRYVAAAAALITAVILSWVPAPAQTGGGTTSAAADLKVTVDVRRFYYVGDPVLIRITLFNDGKTPYDNAKGTDLLGFTAVVDVTGAAMKRKPSPTAETRVQPAVIVAGGFFGFIADLRDAVEGLDKPGRFMVQFKMPGLEVAPTPVVIIPRYDPATAYQATMESDYGRLVFDLLGGTAPKHVQNFYDLANQGYYDSAYINAVIKGVEIHGGDTAGDGSSTPGYDLPFEIDPNVPQRRGTLSMIPIGKTDHGAQFLIALTDQSAAVGQFSAFGVMVSGEEALSAIENLPTNGRKNLPFFRPITEVRIRSIRVVHAPAGSKATAMESPVKDTPKP